MDQLCSGNRKVVDGVQLNSSGYRVVPDTEAISLVSACAANILGLAIPVIPPSSPALCHQKNNLFGFQRLACSDIREKKGTRQQYAKGG